MAAAVPNVKVKTCREGTNLVDVEKLYSSSAANAMDGRCAGISMPSSLAGCWFVSQQECIRNGPSRGKLQGGAALSSTAAD